MSNAMKREKVFVAVHGVGDQFSYETIQAVARQVFKYHGLPGALPLGWLYSQMKSDPKDLASNGLLRYRSVCHRGSPAPCEKCSHDPQYGCFSFSEVYWAGIPRSAVREGYIIEETKSWAKTIVERLRARDVHRNGAKPILSRDEYRTVKEVLVEMIATVRIVERLVAWLEKHTKLRFPLKKVLDEYICDVQVVTEYRQFREKILDEFGQVMHRIHEQNRDAEIYVIAHSEGTVISFIGLLRALSRPVDTESDWVNNVRGFMTLGSPIDKHLILWPELWREFEPEGNSQGETVKWRELKEKDGTPQRIPWYNYYDFGDPVGFDLDTARGWMKNRGGNPPIEFCEQNDIGFSRYVFPGKAHIDYWRDGRVFAHFFENVVVKDEIRHAPISEPRSKRMVRGLSATIPYLLVTGICGLGTYFLYKATVVALHVPNDNMLKNLPIFTLTLAAVTGAARLPRLARAPWSYVTSIILAIVGGFLPFLLEKREIISGAMTANTQGVVNAANTTNLVPLGTPSWWIIPITAAAISVAGWLSSRLKPKWGMIPMLLTGATGILIFISLMLRIKPDVEAWPIAVAGIAFIYLWWIAALIFDLSVVWHRYICLNTGLHKIHTLGRGSERGGRKKTEFEHFFRESKIRTMTET